MAYKCEIAASLIFSVSIRISLKQWNTMENINNYLKALENDQRQAETYK